MFDLVVGAIDRPFLDKRRAPALLSLVVHVLLVAGVIGSSLFVVTLSLPEVPAVMAFVAEVPAAPPPPPPPPLPPPKPSRRVTPPTPAGGPKPVASQFAAPLEVPTEITPETGLVTEAPAEVVGGVDGGVPGGVAGGVLGGIIADLPPPPLPPPRPQEERPVRIGGQIRAPGLTRRVDPEYPPAAVAARVSGVVILEALVDEQGIVKDIKVLGGHSMLQRAAVNAVKQWRYSPLILNGAAQLFILTVNLEFFLE